MTLRSKIWFWGFKWLGNRLVYLLVIIVGFFLFPLAYFFRYQLKKDWLGFIMNDETDFGEAWWRRREGITKYNFWVAYRWYLRNPAWNFNNIFIPRAGRPENVQVTTTVYPRDYDIDWADKENEQYGWMVAHYTVDGITYGRFSIAKEGGLLRELQIGAAGNRYKFRMKGPIITILIALIIGLIIYWIL